MPQSPQIPGPCSHQLAPCLRVFGPSSEHPCQPASIRRWDWIKPALGGGGARAPGTQPALCPHLRLFEGRGLRTVRSWSRHLAQPDDAVNLPTQMKKSGHPRRTEITEIHTSMKTVTVWSRHECGRVDDKRKWSAHGPKKAGLCSAPEPVCLRHEDLRTGDPEPSKRHPCKTQRQTRTGPRQTDTDRAEMGGPHKLERQEGPSLEQQEGERPWTP